MKLKKKIRENEFFFKICKNENFKNLFDEIEISENEWKISEYWFEARKFHIRRNFHSTTFQNHLFTKIKYFYNIQFLN